MQFELMKSSPQNQGIDYIAYKVRMYSVVFSVSFTLVGVCAILIAVWLKLGGNNWSREYLGAGVSFVITALLQYLPWRLAGKFCSKTKKIMSLFLWLFINLTGIALHMATRG
jgi:hypothetical protein